jgi:AcrR family transcriptional regulator
MAATVPNGRTAKVAPVATRGRRNREQELLAAAVDIFWRKGYSAASVQEVADAVGVLKGSLYHYISSKDELLFRVFDQSHHRSLEIMDEVAHLDAGPLERLHEYVRRFIQFYAENVEQVGVYFREWRFIGGDYAKEVRARRAVYDAFIRNLLQEAIDAGQLPASTDPKVVTYYVIAALNGLPDWYRPQGQLKPPEIARRYADLTLAAVGAPPRPAG